MKGSKTQRRLATLLAAALLFGGTLALVLVLRKEPPSVLQRIERSGVLVVATRRGPTTYYDGADGPDGLEHALVREFARDLGVQVRFELPATLAALEEYDYRGYFTLGRRVSSPSPQEELAAAAAYLRSL